MTQPTAEDFVKAKKLVDEKNRAWDERFLALAEHIAGWSKDPSTKVGAVITRPDRTISSIGYNGLPRYVIDGEERLNHRKTKYEMTVHARRAHHSGRSEARGRPRLRRRPLDRKLHSGRTDVRRSARPAGLDTRHETRQFAFRLLSDTQHLRQ